ncbi:MAG: class I tRNA ligase family protein, partial [Puniceicoccales bacterium]|nr:class I tRNA ligase family protein [Puniceicoccales bacterium]
MTIALKDTLNLPVTDFPMRANLVEREPLRIEYWEAMDLYQKIQKKNVDGPTFILHDGPPFTNGDVHIGTALNKILKDIILRYKSMRGYRTPYIPGWDCHGLPIEHKVVKALKEAEKELAAGALREECAQFSRSFMEKQRKQFQRLGVLADWEHEYRTLEPAYEASILEVLAKFVERGQVYRGKKPVYWSIPCKTALAEAEIEYKEHTSQSIYVKFPVSERSLSFFEPHQNISFVIWTTTPWTLPANLAIALNPKVAYILIKSGEEHFIVGEALVQEFTTKCKLNNFEIVGTFLGADLENLVTKHPFIGR